MHLGKIFNYLSFTLLGLLAIPTVAILISWNALPGDRLYPLKRNLEKIALAIVGNHFETEVALRSKLIDRRFDENTTLLTRSSSLGLSELTTEIESTKEEVVKQAQQTQKEEGRKIAQQEAVKLIAQLQKYDQKLEEQKQTLVSTQPPSIYVSEPTQPTPKPVPTPRPIQPVTQPQPTPYQPPVQPPIQPPTVTPPQPPQNVAVQVSQTQQQIQQTIEELRQVAQEKPEEKREEREEKKEEKHEEKQEEKHEDGEKGKGKD